MTSANKLVRSSKKTPAGGQSAAGPDLASPLPKGKAGSRPVAQRQSAPPQTPLPEQTNQSKSAPPSKAVGPLKATPTRESVPAAKSAPAAKRTPVAKPVPAVKPAVAAKPAAAAKPAPTAKPALAATPAAAAKPALVAKPAPAAKSTPAAKAIPAAKPAPQPAPLNQPTEVAAAKLVAPTPSLAAEPEGPSAKPRRGLGLLGKQAFSRAAPALQLLPRQAQSGHSPQPRLPAPACRSAAESPADTQSSLASLIARASAGGTLPSSLDHDTMALLRDELLAILTLTEDPPG
jgi:hypothetical protein